MSCGIRNWHAELTVGATAYGFGLDLDQFRRIAEIASLEELGKRVNYFLDEAWHWRSVTGGESDFSRVYDELALMYGDAMDRRFGTGWKEAPPGRVNDGSVPLLSAGPATARE